MICDLRFQGRDLSKEAVTDAYLDWQKDIDEIRENFDEILAQAKTLSKTNYKIAGKCWMTTRSTLSNLEIDDMLIIYNFRPCREDMNHCLGRIDEALIAVEKSGPANMLRSSMYCETCFSTYTLVRSRWRQRMHNVLLQSHMFGILQSTIMANLDVARVVARFFDKADKFFKI